MAIVWTEHDIGVNLFMGVDVTLRLAQEVSSVRARRADTEAKNCV